MIQDNLENIDETESISLKELIIKIKFWINYLLSKWIVILLLGIVGGIIGLSYAWLKKPTYKAELSFALEDEKAGGGGLGGALGLASQFGIDLGSSGGGAFSGDNLIELLKSRSMIEKTLLSKANNTDDRSLAEIYIQFNKLRDAWQTDPNLKKITFKVGEDRVKFSRQKDSILGEFCKNILMGNLMVEKKDKKLSIINISVKSESELFSKNFAESLVSTVSDFYIATKTKKSVQNVNILQRQTDSVRSVLNGAITSVASSVDANPNPNPLLAVLRVPSQRRQIDVQSNTSLLNQLFANLELAKVSLRKETPLIQIIDKPIYPLEKTKVGKLRGLIIGGMIAGFITVLFLIFKKIFQNIL